MKSSVFNLKDLPFLAELTPPGWPDVEPVFKMYMEMENCFPIAVRQEGRVVAVGCCILLKKSAWIGHVIVHSGYQRKGLGRLIMNELLELIQSRGYQTISLIATDMGFPLYNSLGFKLQEEYTLFSVPENLSLEYSSNIQKFTYKDRESILQMDYKACGEDRSFFLSSRLEDAVGIVKGSSLSGVFIPNAGEGVVLAADPEAGCELLKYKMMHYPEKRVGIPVGNPLAQELCKISECKLIRRPRRMISGSPYPWIPGMIFSRMGGNIG